MALKLMFLCNKQTQNSTQVVTGDWPAGSGGPNRNRLNVLSPIVGTCTVVRNSTGIPDFKIVENAERDETEWSTNVEIIGLVLLSRKCRFLG